MLVGIGAPRCCSKPCELGLDQYGRAGWASPQSPGAALMLVACPEARTQPAPAGLLTERWFPDSNPTNLRYEMRRQILELMAVSDLEWAVALNALGLAWTTRGCGITALAAP